MELRKYAQRNRNAGTQMNADAKTSEALGTEDPTTREESGQKKKKDLPRHSPSPRTLSSG